MIELRWYVDDAYSSRPPVLQYRTKGACADNMHLDNDKWSDWITAPTVIDANWDGEP